MRHTALVNERRANWEVVVYDVAIEGQNSFQIQADQRHWAASLT